MAGAQKQPLRALTPQEEQELHRVEKATSECLDVVKRARTQSNLHECPAGADCARSAAGA